MATDSDVKSATDTTDVMVTTDEKSVATTENITTTNATSGYDSYKGNDDDVNYDDYDDAELFALFMDKAIHEDDIEAQHTLGTMYLFGGHLASDYTQAFYWFNKITEQHNSNSYQKAYSFDKNEVTIQKGAYYNCSDQYRYLKESYYQVGNMYNQGLGKAPNYKKAVEYYIKAAEMGDADSFYELYRIYKDGKGWKKGAISVNQNKDLAFACYSIAMDLYYQGLTDSEPDIYYKLGNMYRYYYISFPSEQDYARKSRQEFEYKLIAEELHSKAFELYKAAAEEDDPLAMLKLAKMYEDNKYFDNNATNQAFNYYKKAALLGNAEAMFRLGRFYYSGQIVDKDQDTAFSWYTQAAEKGDGLLQYNISQEFQRCQQFEQELKWLTKSAERGYVEAQYRLGLAFNLGFHVQKNPVKGSEWIRKAAENGHGAAQGSLAYMYFNGKGVEKDYTKAFNWACEGAKQQDESAMNIQAQMYENGIVVEKNIRKAIAIYNSISVIHDSNGAYRHAYKLEHGHPPYDDDF